MLRVGSSRSNFLQELKAAAELTSQTDTSCLTVASLLCGLRYLERVSALFSGRRQKLERYRSTSRRHEMTLQMTLPLRAGDLHGKMKQTTRLGQASLAKMHSSWTSCSKTVGCTCLETRTADGLRHGRALEIRKRAKTYKWHALQPLRLESLLRMAA